MRCLSSIDSVTNVSLTYWQVCVFGDNCESDGNQNSWVEAYEFAMHRGMDVQQLLESWTLNVAQ